MNGPRYLIKSLCVSPVVIMYCFSSLILEPLEYLNLCFIKLNYFSSAQLNFIQSSLAAPRLLSFGWNFLWELRADLSYGKEKPCGCHSEVFRIKRW